VSSATAAPRRRKPVLVAVDIAVSVVLLLVAIGMTLVNVGYVTIFPTFIQDCTIGQYPGLQCNSTALSIATYGLLTVTILAMFASIGLVIVRLIQRRYTFVWALGGLIVLILAFYIAAWVAGQTVPTS
jgi:hypothetical protein